MKRSPSDLQPVYPLSNLLVPDLIRYVLSSEQQIQVFPKGFAVDNQRLLVPNEYIVVGEGFVMKKGQRLSRFEDPNYLKVGETYQIRAAQRGTIDVRVIKRCYCGGNDAVGLALLREEKPDTELVAIDNVGTWGIFDANQQLIGDLHTGDGNPQGKLKGYPNAYGIGPAVSTEQTIPEITISARPEKLTSQTKVPIKIAIIDSGLKAPKRSVNKEQTCQNTDTGWNFINNTSDTTDTHPQWHGTRIASIIRSISKESTLIPIKVFNDAGTCEFFDVLCALEYARNIGVNIVNASWSFSANPGNRIHLLEYFIERLTQKGIFVVCAAGNAIQYVQDQNGKTLPLGGKDTPWLFPACYSQRRVARSTTSPHFSEKVITVTTVGRTSFLNARETRNRGSLQPVEDLFLAENFSRRFVDVGVVANSGGQFVLRDTSFAAPGFTPAPGSSYATAYFSGIVAEAINNNGPIRSKDVLFAQDPPETGDVDVDRGIRVGYVRK